METVKFIIGVLIVLIGVVTEIKKHIDKNKSAKKKTVDFTPLPVEKKRTAVSDIIHPRIQDKGNDSAGKTVPSVSDNSNTSDSILFEEGQRVTVDQPSSQPLPDIEDDTISSEQADELRNKIIWGEILSRKF